MLARYITLKSIVDHGIRGIYVGIDSMLVILKHEHDETATLRNSMILRPKHMTYLLDLNSSIRLGVHSAGLSFQEA